MSLACVESAGNYFMKVFLIFLPHYFEYLHMVESETLPRRFLVSGMWKSHPRTSIQIFV
jgi:hypothetical protein